MDFTIAETYSLPSRGKIYSVPVKEQVKLRSMTVNEEMKRLSHSNTPYKTLCDIIDDCIVGGKEELGISTYDMHLGDYQYLLHRLRVVTYGDEYPISSVCPICGRQNKKKISLDEINVNSIITDEDIEEFKNLLTIELPKTKRVIKLKFQTPRDLDEILKDSMEFSDANPDSKIDKSYLFTISHLIDEIDGQKTPKQLKDIFLNTLPLMDSNAIIKRATKINDKVGIDPIIKNVCSNPNCGAKYSTSFRITSEFFGPTED